jgi:uncharacterized membrane protein YdjX (TVP38/TMEM64 family)
MEALLEQFLGLAPGLVPVLFVVARAIAIIIPPIPGVIVDTAGLALFPWWLGFMLAQIGMQLGGVTAFILARTLREPLVRKIAPLQSVEVWESQYSEKQKFWTLVLLRLASNAAFDYISYAAGLTKLRLSTFFLSSLLGTIPSMLLFYALGGALVSVIGPWAAALIGVAVSIVVLMNMKTIGESVMQITGGPKKEEHTHSPRP